MVERPLLQAFNNKLTSVPRHFPEAVREALAFAPYLNGGLFSENELDRKRKAVGTSITDKRFRTGFQLPGAIQLHHRRG